MAPHLIIFATAFYVISRFILVLGYDIYLSDAGGVYFRSAVSGMTGLHAYSEFDFPYPPASLPFIYLPYLFGTDRLHYRFFFQIEMLAFDILTVWFLVKLMQDVLKINRRWQAVVITFYSVASLCTGHLIHDRLDIVIACVFAASLYYALSGKRDSKSIIALATFGFLFKLIPALFVFPILAASRLRSGHNKKAIFFDISLFLIFSGGILFFYDYLTGGGLFVNLSAHKDRSIQIESTWASPFFLSALFSAAGKVDIIQRWGAAHINPESINGVYLFLSKYFGFFLIVVWHGIYFIKGMRRFSPHTTIYFCSTILVTLVASQRVLSPQFFIWLLPAACLLIAIERSKTLIAALFFIYLLTYAEFDLGYFKIIQLDPLFISVLTVRNFLTVAVTLYLSFMTIKETKKL